MIPADPFFEFRKPQPAFESTTGSDNRSLTLVAIDVAAFHPSPIESLRSRTIIAGASPD
jgi:hypothetical protein